MAGPPDRLPSGMRIDRRYLAVVLLAFAALVVRDAGLPHRHDAAAPGLYNHDHDLSTLATVAGGLLPDSPQAGPILVVLASPPTLAISVWAEAPRSPAEPRAPPHQEPPRDDC